MELKFPRFQRVFSFTILADLLVVVFPTLGAGLVHRESSINHNESRNVSSTYYVLLARVRTSYASFRSVFTKTCKIGTIIISFYR